MSLFRFITALVGISFIVGCGDNPKSPEKKSILKDGSTLPTTRSDSSNITVTDENFWRYNNLLNELIDKEEFKDALYLAKEINESNISKENRLSFYLSYFMVLMDNQKPDSALKILRIRYVSNPLEELSKSENMYSYYFWGTALKLQSSECDSAKYYFDQLTNLKLDRPIDTEERRVEEIESIKRVLNESCN